MPITLFRQKMSFQMKYFLLPNVLRAEVEYLASFSPYYPEHQNTKQSFTQERERVGFVLC